MGFNSLIKRKDYLTESQSKIQSNPEMLKREKCVIGKYQLKESWGCLQIWENIEFRFKKCWIKQGRIFYNDKECNSQRGYKNFDNQCNNLHRRNIHKAEIMRDARRHSAQFSCSVVSDSLRPHELQHARPPCPSTPGVHSDSRPSSRWCHPAISSSVVPFSSCPQSLPASELFQWVNSLHEVAKVLEFQL